MHSPHSDSIKLVVRQRHGRTGKNSPAATKLQREEWARVMTLKLLFTKQHVFLWIVCKILFELMKICIQYANKNVLLCFSVP